MSEEELAAQAEAAAAAAKGKKGDVRLADVWTLMHGFDQKKTV